MSEPTVEIVSIIGGFLLLWLVAKRLFGMRGRSRALAIRRRAIREKIYRDGMICIRCGYNMRASPGRCSECGYEPSPSISHD